MAMHPAPGQEHGVHVGHQSGLAGRGEGVERAGRRSAGNSNAVPQLQQLHRPLDVGQATPAELGVGGRVGPAGQALGVDPGLDAADLGDLLGGQPAGRDSGPGRPARGNARPGRRRRPTNRARSSACASQIFDQSA